jgi:hypothetical protein
MKRIAYGLSPSMAIFEGLTAIEIGERLRQSGCDGVFMHSPTPAWCEALHSVGLQVYAALGIFSGKGLWERFPKARPIKANGEPVSRVEWYEPVIPTLPDLRAQRLQALEALIQAAPLDGVWLDAIRWPSFWEHQPPLMYETSFDPLTLSQFQEDMNISLPLKEKTEAGKAAWILTYAADAWHTWRCRQIETFVIEAKACLQQHRPTALLGIFTVPWTEADFDGTRQASVEPNVHPVIGQDLTLLAPHVDVISPMVYHRMCERPPTWVGDVTTWVQDRAQDSNGETYVWPIVEVVEDTDVYPNAEFVAACQAAIAAQADAVMVFTLEGVFKNPSRVAAWRNLRLDSSLRSE